MGTIMEFSNRYKTQTDKIISLFGATFADSEGNAEGKLIAGLVKDLLVTTKDEEIYVFSTWADEMLVGCIIFSRLSYEEDPRQVFILSPVAVETSQQGKGIGQELLKYGLKEIQKHGIDVAITYGDPNYYSKVGFTQITEHVAQPPLALNYPNGWLAQPLSGMHLDPLKGPSRCVPALNNPVYW